MHELRYLVLIRKRGPFGLTYAVPVLRTALVNRRTFMHFGRRFPFEELSRLNPITREAEI